MKDSVELKWISVEDRLPDVDEEVLVRAEHTKVSLPNVRFVNKRVENSRYTDGNGFLKFWDYRDYVITHWWYIPKFE